MALEPITRQEKIIAGQDLTPVTRKEMFLKQFGGGGGGGTDDVYLIKRIINGETGTEELQGDYAGALAARQSGKKLKFIDAFDFNGQELVYCESFSYVYTPSLSEFKFVCYTGSNFNTYTLTESGITSSGNNTHVESLYVDRVGGLFLTSTGSPAKTFKIMVSNTGELSTEEVT